MYIPYLIDKLYANQLAENKLVQEKVYNKRRFHMINIKKLLNNFEIKSFKNLKIKTYFNNWNILLKPVYFDLKYIITTLIFCFNIILQVLIRKVHL